MNTDFNTIGNDNFVNYCQSGAAASVGSGGSYIHGSTITTSSRDIMKLKPAGAAVVNETTGVVEGTYDTLQEAERAARRLANKNAEDYLIVRPVKRIGPKPVELSEEPLL